eukprot:CAMPEP_0119492502 /NCGR_PEP_ID=MMETSP1344-20130328/17038_1 /TAXON_ID=236787 /ORGANISM="Florenciella parvula, Strain CCMP2471" /LENGTH=96 /DNA_ID=CAMNT_0007527841 /DNA_START=128 /DNA_END=414 /DNA_ORIENTATION=+
MKSAKVQPTPLESGHAGVRLVSIPAQDGPGRDAHSDEEKVPEREGASDDPAPSPPSLADITVPRKGWEPAEEPADEPGLLLLGPATTTTTTTTTTS